MGVAGAGKTTVGRALSADLDWPFVDADDLQSRENVAKMQRGEPLTDSDRAPWLASVRALLVRAIDRREPLVIACSALKHAYRESLQQGLRGVRFVYLAAGRELLDQRLKVRVGHFAGPGLLASQLADLEEPHGAITVPAGDDPRTIVRTIRRELGA